MVLSPEELEKRVEGTMQAHVNDFVRKIDEYLVGCRMGFKQRDPYTYSLSPHISEAFMKHGQGDELIQRVIKAYDDAGWDLSYDSKAKQIMLKKKKQ